MLLALLVCGGGVLLLLLLGPGADVRQEAGPEPAVKFDEEGVAAKAASTPPAAVETPSPQSADATGLPAVDDTPCSFAGR